MVAKVRDLRPGESVMGGRGVILVGSGRSPSAPSSDAKTPSGAPPSDQQQDDLMLPAAKALEQALAKKFGTSRG